MHSRFLVALGAFLLFATNGNGFGGQVVGPARPGRGGRLPNIVVVLFDDVGYQDLHVVLPEVGTVYRHEGVPSGHRIRTPHIGVFAREAMVFTRAAMNGTVCSPTRAALLTGVHPLRFGLNRAIGNHSLRGLPDDPTIALLPELLRERGYRTIHVGKWHLGFRKDKFLPVSKGYDVAVRLARETVGRERIVERHGDRKELVCFHGFRRYDDGPTGRDYLNPCYDLLAKSEDGRLLRREDGAPGRHTASVLTDWAMCLVASGDVDAARSCVERLAREGMDALPPPPGDDRPFFLSLWYWGPHSPAEPPPTRQERDAGHLAVPDWDLLPPQCVPKDRSQPGDTSLVARWKFEELVCYLDHVLSRLFSYLERTGDTLVIVTSDNGGTSSYHRRYGGNGYLSGYKGGVPDGLEEGSVRVPLLVRWRGHVGPGQVNPTPVTSLDLLPTIAEIVGIDLSGYRVEGMSILPALLGGKVLRRPGPIAWEHMEKGPLLDRHRDLVEPPKAYREKFAVLDGPWKLVGLPGPAGGSGPATRLYRLYDRVPPMVTTYREEGDERRVMDERRIAAMTSWYSRWRETESRIPFRIDAAATRGIEPCRGRSCMRFPGRKGIVVLEWDDRFDFSDGGFSFVTHLRPDPKALGRKRRMFVAGRKGSWELVLERDAESKSWYLVGKAVVERVSKKTWQVVGTDEVVVRSRLAVPGDRRGCAVQLGFENYKRGDFLATLVVREGDKTDRVHARLTSSGPGGGGWLRVASGNGCERGMCAPVTLGNDRPGGDGFVGKMEDVRFHTVVLNDDEW